MSTLNDDLRTLSREAYLYLYPLVTMDVSRQQSINVEADARPGYGPANEFHHIRTFPAADFRAVVRPNFDTLYSSAWVDVSRGPVVVHLPDTDDRYVMLPMLDMWTDVFANPGKRTTGTGTQDFVLTMPGYSGAVASEAVPPGAVVIPAPTPSVWIIGRSQTNGPADYDAVNRLQDGMTISALGGTAPHAIDPNLDTTTEPLTVVNGMSGVEFLAYGAQCLAANPPHATDFSILARIAALGIVPGRPFDASRFDAAQIAEIEAGAVDAREAMHAAVPRLGVADNGWTMSLDTMGVYGNHYLKRAVITMIGLGANPPEDAIYPLLAEDADGEPPIGERSYVLHFEEDELPPVSAFWSVTMYDEEGFQAPNELDRFALGDRDPLIYNADGSLDLYLQHDNPGPERVANWLPAPDGPLGITMRLYAPQPQALDGRWAPPPLRRAE